MYGNLLSTGVRSVTLTAEEKIPDVVTFSLRPVCDKEFVNMDISIQRLATVVFGQYHPLFLQKISDYLLNISNFPLNYL